MAALSSASGYVAVEKVPDEPESKKDAEAALRRAERDPLLIFWTPVKVSNKNIVVLLRRSASRSSLSSTRPQSSAFPKSASSAQPAAAPSQTCLWRRG